MFFQDIKLTLHNTTKSIFWGNIVGSYNILFNQRVMLPITHEYEVGNDHFDYQDHV
jgi:hypothetical protein